MGWISDARPSPAIVVAVLALTAALAGTALAGPQATSSAINKKKVKKIARKQINKLAPGLSVASADTATTANSADTADSANTANRADTANTATQAQNAATANGVRPVKVNFAAPTNTPATTLVNQGGVRITGECDSGGNSATEFTSTANNGVIGVYGVNTNNTTQGFVDDDWDTGAVGVIVAGAAPTDIRTVTVTYRGASGTAVTGELVTARSTGAAQCVIGGTLFVG